MYKYIIRPAIEKRRARKVNALTETPAAKSSPRQTTEVNDDDIAETITNGENDAVTKAQKHRRRVYRWKVIAGLSFPSFLAAVDTTIVAPALPTIASSFNKLGTQLNWIVTAYTLTSTSFIPAFGQIADIYGRHTALQISLTFMLIGSTLCAAAQAWGMLLLGRALQGISAAGIGALLKIIISDDVSLEDNSKNNTIFSLISGLSFAVGPVIGGYLTAASWRYCFVLSIPIVLVAQVIIFFVLRKELRRGSYDRHTKGRSSFMTTLANIDVGGSLLFIFGTGLLILAITWAGTTYAWSSAAVVAPLVIGSLLSLGFFCYEYLSEPGRVVSRILPRQVPMVPWSLFSKKDAFLLSVIQVATGVSLYSAFYFISIYWSVAEGLSPSDAGIQLLYYTPGLGAGVYLAMFFCNSFPAQTFHPIFAGTVIEAAGISILTWAVTTRRRPLVNGIMGLAGVGTGLRLMPNTLHAAGIWRSRIAAIMSLLEFCIPFGGTLSIGIMTSVFTNKFEEALRALLSSAAAESSSTGDGRAAAAGLELNSTSLRGVRSLSAINDLPVELREKIRNAAARAVMWAFVSILPFMAISVLAAAVLGNVWIKTEGVVYGPYLGAVFRRRVSQEKEPLDREIPVAIAAEEAKVVASDQGHVDCDKV